MPARIYKEVRYRDSLMHAKDSSYLIAKGYIKIIKDTMGLDDEDDTESLDRLKKAKQKEELEKSKKQRNNDSALLKLQPEAILPDERNKPTIKDSVNK